LLVKLENEEKSSVLGGNWMFFEQFGDFDDIYDYIMEQAKFRNKVCYYWRVTIYWTGQLDSPRIWCKMPFHPFFYIRTSAPTLTYCSCQYWRFLWSLSKTDQYWEGAMGTLAPTHSQVCPMNMMEWYGALVLLLLISKLWYKATCIGFCWKGL